MRRKLHLPSYVTALPIVRDAPISAPASPEVGPRLPADQDVARTLIAMHSHGVALSKCIKLHLSEVGKYVLLDLARKELGYPAQWPIERTTAIDKRYRELLASSALNVS